MMRCLFVAFVAVSTACASHSRPTSFPRPDELAAIAASTETEVRVAPPKRVTSFEVPGPFPTSWSFAEPTDDPLVNLLKQQLPNNGHRPTAAAQCVARASAQYTLEHGGEPPPDLKDYIQARCRAPWSAAVPTRSTTKAGAK